MNLACTMAPQRGETDRLLSALAGRLLKRGVRLCGTVQANVPGKHAGTCDMDVTILPGGPVIRISQSLGAEAQGCRLDAGALETAVNLATQRLRAGADLLIVNKFGKQEASGRGFRDLIASALAEGIPVLVGLNTLNHVAFSEFAGGLERDLPPDAASLDRWVAEVLGPAAAPVAGSAAATPSQGAA